MISLITTVLNEKNNLSLWLNSIAKQSVRPDEIVIVDGGSTDGTWQWLEEKATGQANLKVFQFKGNISQGRNYAISKAKHDKIVVTDAGCQYHSEWFSEISLPLRQGKPAATTGFSAWLKHDDGLKIILIAAATIPIPREFNKDWLPSSRSVAFTKQTWQAAGKYPEWLPICEDIIYDLKIKLNKIIFTYIRESLVEWRPRLSWSAYAKQLYRYTRGDGHAKLWHSRQFIRYIAYLAGIFLFFIFLTGNIKALLLMLIGGSVYTFKYWKRFFYYVKQRSLVFKVLGFFILPFVIIVGDIAKMCGWLVGVWQRLTGKIKFENWRV